MVKLGFGMTAWEIHEMAMKDLEKCETSIDDSIVQRNIPTLEQARTYVDCEYKLNCYWRRKYPEGIIPYRQGEKWGLLHFGVTTGIIFDDIIIESECYARGKIGEEWFFIDGYGKPTKKENEAWFGSWIDADR